jgi:CheY-like chemotaxis protein
MSHRLLLADDSVTIQRVIELTFADEDIDVVTAGDGEQAIASIQAEPPDIVLADVGMPKRSGYDVAAFVKGAPELSHIPVLLLTGAFEPVDERRAQEAGCDGVLVKPFEPQHVIARVRELLQTVSRTTAAAPAGNVTRAVSDVPRPAERFAHHRPQAAPRPATAHGRDLDDYFDRLDAAFANMSNAAEASGTGQPEPAPRREGPVMERDLDWFDSPSQDSMRAAAAEQAPPPQAASARQVPPPPDASVGQAPASPVEAQQLQPEPVTFATPPRSSSWPVPFPSIESHDPVPPREPQPGRAAHPSQDVPASGSPIADAFSALLAAEQGDPDAPAVQLPIAHAPTPITDAMLDDIARRIADRIGSRAVDDLVAAVVSRIAERLVREEIQRIRDKHS